MSSRQWRCVDLCCGAGGLSEGLRQAGWRVALGVDTDRVALTSYQRNFGQDTTALELDLRALTAPALLRACGGRRPDLLVAGPPCQGHSLMGRRQPDDMENDLIGELARLVEQVRPPWALLENVPALATSGGGKFLMRARARLDEAGYESVSGVLSSAMYGVPQHRQRLFVLATNTGAALSLPPPSHGVDGVAQVSVGDALGDLPLLGARLRLELSARQQCLSAGAAR